MEKGIRKKILISSGSSLYFIKAKKWKYTASIRTNPNNNDVYVISDRKNFKNWHNNEIMQMVILHELGHLDQHFSNHFINELLATFIGWFKYSYLAPLVNWKSPFKLIKLSFRYMINSHYKSKRNSL